MKKKMCAIFLAALLAGAMVFTGCGSKGGEKSDGTGDDKNSSVTEESTGEASLEAEEIQEEGWVLSDNIMSLYFTDEQLETFQEISAEYEAKGLYYTPIAVIASQVVNGTNYMYFVFENNMDGNNQTFSYKMMILNHSSDGTNSEVSISDFDVNCIKTFKISGNPSPEQLSGGWTLNPELTEGVFMNGEDEVFSKAMESYEGDLKLLPVYAFACKESDSEEMKFFSIVPGADEEATELYVVSVEKDGDSPVVTSVRALNYVGYTE